MKRLLATSLIAALATPALGGELFSGTHTYRPDYEQWTPVPAAGWWTTVMVGDYEPISGPIPAGRVECRGSGYWNKSTRDANGVCVFGEQPDTWMLRYSSVETDRATQTAAGYLPIGEWTALQGTGIYSGITGSGTYLAEQGVAEGGKYRTRWEGEVTIPK